MTDWDWLVLLAKSPRVLFRAVDSFARFVAVVLILFFLVVSLLALMNGLWTSGREALVVLPIVGLFLLLLVIAVGAFEIADERDFKRPRTDR